MRVRAFVEGAVGEKPSDRGRGWLDQSWAGTGTVRRPERPRCPDDRVRGELRRGGGCGLTLGLGRWRAIRRGEGHACRLAR